MPNDREWIFYAASGAAVLLTEISLQFGLHMFTLLPLMLGVLAVGLWAFPENKK